MSDVTRILKSIEDGNPKAAEELLPLVYDELRKLAAAKMAQEKPGQTLQATALVHEAYVRLVDVARVQKWDSRRHFFSAAAEAMRRILVENVRQKRQLKRGGDRQRRSLDSDMEPMSSNDEELMAVNDALQKLAEEDPQASELIKLRYFAAMSVEDAAESLGIARSTAYKHWAHAKSWLQCELESPNPGG